jgi:phosphoribosylanthranilate isomerase
VSAPRYPVGEFTHTGPLDPERRRDCIARPRVKVCCIGGVAEADLAVRHGAAALGLVSRMPSGPGVIEEALISEIARTVPPGVATFLLTSRERADEIAAQQRRCRTGVVQLCDRVPDRDYAALRRELPGIGLVQVIHVTGPESEDEAIAIAPEVDAILLDSGNQARPVKELGGTGRVHDWRLSRRIREAVPVPVFLAGGLSAANVRRAMDEVDPFGLDLCSGVRTGGRLDQSKLAAFMEVVWTSA